MRFPVGNTGSKEEFWKDWYVAQNFGKPTSYGFHEGADINLKTLGDSDLGQELKSIADGKVVYYHYSSHPSSSFGRHMVVKIDGAWGTRWVHYAHCQKQDFTNTVKDVNEGQIIGRLGKTGTPYAHLHFAIFKVDPVSLGGIDRIAKTDFQLHSSWEDPIAFIEKWMEVPAGTPEPEITDQSKFDFGDPWGVMEMQEARSKLNDQASTIESLETKIETAINVLS